LVLCFTYHIDYDSYILIKGELEMTNEVTTTKQTSMANVDISSVITEVIEYAKDQSTTTDIANLIASVPKTSSMDWKLVSGVIMNSLVEWVVENKDNDNVKSLALIQHLQKDVGYLLKRLGLAQ
tara:strand:+ start:623 stop:994 length:372 start_codon:yes stop_codon:yes gene_type:complete